MAAVIEADAAVLVAAAEAEAEEDSAEVVSDRAMMASVAQSRIAMLALV